MSLNRACDMKCPECNKLITLYEHDKLGQTIGYKLGKLDISKYRIIEIPDTEIIKGIKTFQNHFYCLRCGKQFDRKGETTCGYCHIIYKFIKKQKAEKPKNEKI